MDTINIVSSEQLQSNKNKFDKKFNKNITKVVGKIVTEPVHSHDFILNKRDTKEHIIYSRFVVDIQRLSGVSDFINVVIKSNLINEYKVGQTVEIAGQLRSRSTFDGVKNKLDLFILANAIRENEEVVSQNDIEIDGYICTEPNSKTTLTGRNITEFIIAVNRIKATSYIPIIVWNSEHILKIGDKLNLKGRFQSRDYIKRLETGEDITKTAYELSVSKLELLF
ncbi:MAG: single-stranded DNA-binding protein [Defluviitaleaceae bacterium]|nr:single-stranded DNA-binding protein [Defluviitaleaceae bacterium]